MRAMSLQSSSAAARIVKSITAAEPNRPRARASLKRRAPSTGRKLQVRAWRSARPRGCCARASTEETPHIQKDSDGCECSSETHQHKVRCDWSSVSCAMALASFQLMQTLRNSPAALSRARTQSLAHGDPLFKLHYLGTRKIFSLDLQQAEASAERLLEATPTTTPPKDHALVVRPRYVEVKELSTGRQLTKTLLRDIAYCASHRARPHVFLIICRRPGQQLQCRAFWCPRAERARDIAACLAQSFQRALTDQQGGCGTLPEGPGTPPTLRGSTPPTLRGSNPPTLRGSTPPTLRGSTPPTLRGFTPPTRRSSTLPASLGKVRWRKRGSLTRHTSDSERCH